jgi:hypothetical protein
MPPLKDWSLESLLALFGTIGAAIGGAIVWLTSKGTDWYIRIGDWRMKRKERIAKMNTRENWTARDQLLEDKNLSAGYRALFLAYDARMQGLEEREATRTVEMQQLYKGYNDCLESHAKADEKIEQCGNLVEALKSRCAKLEEDNEKYRNKLLRNGFRPDDASPIHLEDKGKKPDKPFQS